MFLPHSTLRPIPGEIGLTVTYEENTDSIPLKQQEKGNLRRALARNSEAQYYFP